MTSSGQPAAEETRRGVIVRLPAEDSVAAAIAARLDFVVVDLYSGPADELALARLVFVAKAAGLRVLAVCDMSPERLLRLGVDDVVEPGHPGLVIVADAAATDAALAENARMLALDIREVGARAIGDFAAASGSACPPIVLLPGMLGSAALFADVALELADVVSCRPQRIDLDESITGAAESVLAAAPPRFAIAGHSLGGIVALEMWRQAPHRVTRMALLNTSARAPTDAQLDAWAEMRARTEAGGFAAVVAEQAKQNVGRSASGQPALVDRFVESATDVGADGFVRQLIAQASREDRRATLGQISVPILVVSGADDEVCPPEIQIELAAAIPGARHITIEGCGHMSPLDHPAEVAAALRDWLAS